MAGGDEADACALSEAGAFLATLAAGSADPPGVTRASFGAGERMAHGEARAVAERLGLAVTVDPVGTLTMTLPGRDRSLPAGMIGSHLDSAPHGGTLDGAAAVAMGLALAACLVHPGGQPARDLVIRGIRAEEMVWFPAHDLGSRAAFGLLPEDAADTLRRSDTGRTLAEHMAKAGFDPGFIRARRASLAPGQIAWFIEPHIERGAALVEADIPVGLVTGSAARCGIATAACSARMRLPARRRVRRRALRCRARAVLGRRGGARRRSRLHDGRVLDRPRPPRADAHRRRRALHPRHPQQG